MPWRKINVRHAPVCRALLFLAIGHSVFFALAEEISRLAGEIIFLARGKKK